MTVCPFFCCFCLLSVILFVLLFSIHKSVDPGFPLLSSFCLQFTLKAFPPPFLYITVISLNSQSIRIIVLTQISPLKLILLFSMISKARLVYSSLSTSPYSALSLDSFHLDSEVCIHMLENCFLPGGDKARQNLRCLLKSLLSVYLLTNAPRTNA